MTAALSLVPELVVADPDAAARMLRSVFGFADDGAGLLRLGGQRVALRRGAAGRHGPIDHLALAVDDLDAALAATLARGGVMDTDVTPDGAQFIPEFWGAGVRYVFLRGPEGARIELCARPGTSRAHLPSHDHIGIACRDLPAMRAFFLAQGGTEQAAVTLHRQTGDVAVCFIAVGASVVELYAPPGLAALPGQGVFWNRLLVEGARNDVAGPEGIHLGHLPPR